MTSPDYTQPFDFAAMRGKVLDKTITLEEMQEVVRQLRAGRKSAVQSGEAKRKAAAKKVVPSADELLQGLLDV